MQNVSWGTIALAVTLVGCGKAKEGPDALGKPAELFGPLTKLKFGMSDIDLVKVAPEFTIDCTNDCRAKATVGGVEYRVKLTDVSRRVYEMGAELDGQKPEVVFDRWGAGTKVATRDVVTDGSYVFYTSADRTKRAWVSKSGVANTTRVAFRPLLPLDKLIDAQRGGIGDFALLGRKIGDVRAEATERGYPQELDRIRFPPTELGDTETSVSLQITDGVVTEFYMLLPTTVPGAKQQIHGMLERVFGKPSPGSGGLTGTLVYPAKFLVTTREDAKNADIFVTVGAPST